MERQDLARLGRALWGAGIAWMFSLLALSLYLPLHRADPSPSANIIPAYAGLSLDNGPTKYFLVAFFVLGSACAYLVSQSAWAGRLNGPAVWLGVSIFVPVASRCTADVFARQASGWAALIPSGCLLVPVAVTAVLAWLRSLRGAWLRGCSNPW